MKSDTKNEELFELENGRLLGDVHRELRELYLSDERPWVIGYSGGKDSTTILQLTWNVVAQLSPEKRRKTVYVISSDTLVENPLIMSYISQTISRINEAANHKQMPFSAEILKPRITQSFWVNLIGRGYPAPQKGFRWCTDRLKIKPANRFIMEKISKHGEVVLVLGLRRSESMSRAQMINTYQIPCTPLSRHSRFSGAYVYAPIKDFTLEDVWNYLLFNPSPWGNNNQDLLTLYRSATGECPFVVDETTPSCGGSRFGCWVCTVVTYEKSMKALISSGEGWMLPLLKIRDFLASTQDPEMKQVYREYKRRQGMVSFKSDGSGIISRGPYQLEVCKGILARVLSAQMDVRSKGPDSNMQLILPEELHEIRRIWRTERGDWEDSVPQIYRQITGSVLEWVQDDLGAFSKTESQLLEEICNGRGVPPRLVAKLLDAEMQSQGMSRRSSIYNKIESVLGEEWRTEQELVRDIQSANMKSK